VKLTQDAKIFWPTYFSSKPKPRLVSLPLRFCLAPPRDYRFTNVPLNWLGGVIANDLANTASSFRPNKSRSGGKCNIQASDARAI
jgi:hypothetical protein